MVTEAVTKPTKTIPGIRELPLVGSIPEHNRDRLALYLRVARECGDIGRFHFGPFPLILLNSSELVHSTLVEHVHDFDKGDVIRNAMRPVIGNGLFISEGEMHRRRRKLMAPSFQPRHIVNYADTMVRYGEQVQVTTLAQRVTFELIPGQTVEPDPSKTITIRPKHELRAIVRRRHMTGHV